jgi:putative transcriptional regulator
VSESLRGQLLVAGPALLDPNFHRTVVLVCEHDSDGAMGLVLNRPSPIPAEQAIPELDDALKDGDTLWVGGPVQTTSVVVLADFTSTDTPALRVHDDVGLVLPEADLEAVHTAVRRARAFLGYAGWGPRQLDGELDGDDWIVADFEPEDAFTDDPDGLWARVLERKGGQYKLLATMPPDPSVN